MCLRFHLSNYRAVSHGSYHYGLHPSTGSCGKRCHHGKSHPCPSYRPPVVTRHCYLANWPMPSSGIIVACPKFASDLMEVLATIVFGSYCLEDSTPFYSVFGLIRLYLQASSLLQLRGVLDLVRSEGIF
ncbi:hypothetical protein XAUC_43270 [Xanthomonas citri pv. aurantifolii str. ICPB 10535]|nr:hypothetical protein XAUC_43270 [Xanthomonas citri pv. aurantifolii str. ICPB 10535]